MLYKFKSKAAGDVIMTGPIGDAVLRTMGKEAGAKGIVLPADMPSRPRPTHAPTARRCRRAKG